MLLSSVSERGVTRGNQKPGLACATHGGAFGRDGGGQVGSRERRARSVGGRRLVTTAAPAVACSRARVYGSDG